MTLCMACIDGCYNLLGQELHFLTLTVRYFIGSKHLFGLGGMEKEKGKPGNLVPEASQRAEEWKKGLRICVLSDGQTTGLIAIVISRLNPIGMVLAMTTSHEGSS